MLRYLDDITLICPPEIADETYHVLRQVLTEDGMLLNEDKCIAFTSDGSPPTQETTKELWENSKDHRGFIVCGFPSTYEDQAAEAPVAFPHRRRSLRRQLPGGSSQGYPTPPQRYH